MSLFSNFSEYSAIFTPAVALLGAKMTNKIISSDEFSPISQTASGIGAVLTSALFVAIFPVAPGIKMKGGGRILRFKRFM
jgi:hypothetical protein